MALTNAFFDAVNTGNIRRVRIMMKDSLLIDPSFEGFSEMEKAACKMDGLYDEHDGREFITDQSVWDDDYMNKLMVQVVSNFSHERINHLKEVVCFLRPVAKSVKQEYSAEHQKSIYTEPTRTSYQEQKYRDQQNGNYIGAKIAAGAVAGAVVGGMVATAVGFTVIGGSVVGALVGGATVSIAVNGGK